MFTHLIDQQSLADEMKRHINMQQPIAMGQRHRALKAISAFEGLPWHPLAFEEAIKPETASTPTQGTWAPLTTETVPRIVIRYRRLIAPGASTLYDLDEAAEYLDLSAQGVKYHVYDTKLLEGAVKGHTLIFTQQQLDSFLMVKPKKRGPQKKA